MTGLVGDRMQTEDTVKTQIGPDTDTTSSGQLQQTPLDPWPACATVDYKRIPVARNQETVTCIDSGQPCVNTKYVTR